MSEPTKHIVYVLMHEYTVNDEDVPRMIGVFDSEETALRAAGALKGQPGFCKAPDGFSVDAYEVNAVHWQEGFVSWADAEAHYAGREK
jgi:hypothetical protein